MDYGWDRYFSIYKTFKGNRFSTIKKKVNRLSEVTDDILLLSALDSSVAHEEAKEFAEYCSRQIIPLVEKRGDEAASFALCCYLYCHFNSPKVIIAEVYDLFYQVGKSLEKINKYKNLSSKISFALHNMGYYVGLAGATTKSGMFKSSKYNDDDRRSSWPIKLPKDLSIDDLINIANLLSHMSSLAIDLDYESTTIFIGLTQTNKCCKMIMEEVNKNVNKEDG